MSRHLKWINVWSDGVVDDTPPHKVHLNYQIIDNCIKRVNSYVSTPLVLSLIPLLPPMPLFIQEREPSLSLSLFLFSLSVSLSLSNKFKEIY